MADNGIYDGIEINNFYFFAITSSSTFAPRGGNWQIIVVFAGLMPSNFLRRKAAIDSTYFLFVKYTRQINTSESEAPALRKASSINSNAKANCASIDSGNLPVSGSIPVVPETTIKSPSITAREKPANFSKFDLKLIVLRDMTTPYEKLAFKKILNTSKYGIQPSTHYSW